LARQDQKGRIYLAAAIISAVILGMEHLLISQRRTVSLPPAFFTLNSLVSMGLGLATLVSLAF
jgi:4-hydroxybenzoate polyprenyltransferase